MTRFPLPLLFVLLILPAPAWARCPPQVRAWVSLDPMDPQTRADQLRPFRGPCTAILDRVGDHYLVSAPSDAFLAWEDAGFRILHVGAEPVPPPALRWSEVGPRLVELATGHPSMARLHRLGTSPTGLPVFALEIAAAPGEPPAKPVVRITGAHHGDETVSTDIVMGLAAFLVTEEARSLRDRFSFWLVPVVNPEGYDARDRYNDAGVDLNRDYGMYWDEERAPFSQPETRTQLQLGIHLPPLVSLDYHSAAEYVNTVYDGSSVTPPELDTILEMGEVYAGPADLEVIVGYQWYAAYGSCQDFLHGTLGTLAYTIETLQPSNTGAIVTRNVTALRELLAHLGDRMVCGRVTDTSGRPLRARLQVAAQPQPFFTSATGDFCHVPDVDPVGWIVEAPGHARGTFSTPLASLPDPLVFELEPATTAFGAFRLISAGRLGAAANTPNPAYLALGTPDGRFFLLGREGFVVLDPGLALHDGPGAELTVVLDPARQGARLRVAVSDLPQGPFSGCGDFTGDFDLDLADCGATSARFVRLENLLQSPQAAIDGLLIPWSSVPTGVDADHDGVTADADCDDTRAEVGPGFEELCDGLDNDCDGLIDEGWPVDAAGRIDCSAADAGPDAGDADADGDTDAGPDADADADADTPRPKTDDGLSCQCRHSGGRAPVPAGLVFSMLFALALRRKILP